ncbi:flagellar motor switch protein FliM [Pseudooceanicola nanhaiensis]|uniref:flagellar motor switch protein FliM n=1 Tax=Pseudooceanicola nanhaiensis TaxID=375761 RepID=UPI001CD3A9BD|nr:FliM/FliN family flagellar motor switch protein [Pseudooceanicola nanhaiensis]MCA0922637.1 FliM/FliN family flagellar motor switch protein [Pseudooceanicola nanhaiensis]
MAEITRPTPPEELNGAPIEEQIIQMAKLSYERLPLLEVIFDRFALSLGPALKSYCGVLADAELEGFEYMPYSEALEGLSANGLVAITQASEWDSEIATVLDPDLLFTALEIMLGGRTVKGSDWAPRSFTAIERRLGTNICEVILRELSTAFSQLSDNDFTIDHMEGNPHTLVLAPPGSPCVRITYKITLDERVGKLSFVIPNNAIDKVRPTLAQAFRGGQLGGDDAWRALLTDQISDTSVTLAAVLHEPVLPLTSVLQWKRGQVLDLGIDSEHEVTVTCSGKKMFRAAMGRRKNGSVALRVTEDFDNAKDMKEGGFSDVVPD